MTSVNHILNPKVLAFERALQKWDGGSSSATALTVVRAALVDAIADACNISSPPSKSDVSEILEAAARANKGAREAAQLVIRALAVDGVLESQEQDSQLSRRIVSLVESGMPDLCKYARLEGKRQTFEKRNTINGIHALICGQLEILRSLPPSMEEINKLKNDISKALRHSQCAAYLHPFCWSAFKAKLDNICTQIDDLTACQDATYKTRFEQLKESCLEIERLGSENYSFLVADYVRPFCASVSAGLEALRLGSIERFACSLAPRRKAPGIAEKRYPLHQIDRMLTITIPMVNRGPGVAVDTVVELDCGESPSIALEAGEIRIGDVPPGEFAIAFRALVVEPADKADIALQVSWRQLFGEQASDVFGGELLAQDPTVNWNELDQLDPYSLEVAQGTAFVGRVAKVQSIGNRLLKSQMSSTYITGQKRVGKTSLARAVLEYVRGRDADNNYSSLYLEYGEYSRADAGATVKALGGEIFQFLRSFLPQEMRIDSPDFTGSLAPLNGIARALETTQPSRRFIVVLDEFDEIHPEMYRYGPLAEAFFANLRTLSARRNLAFLLVGGERMPFIIGAQGDQLNKFVRERLDHFSRSDEWADYIELVTRPVLGALNWDEPAINELFNLTNGHPYYTKLLGARVFSTAVRERDTEIIASDVRHAANTLVPELDTNSFAHFWKDGIDGDREHAEVMELKRSRVLVALGRSLRGGERTVAAIASHLPGRMQHHEVRPIIDDFCRRDVMQEQAGEVQLTLPIFQHWLAEIGVTKLISSTLADELEKELQRAEDEAFVKAGELEKLAKNWPLYRGREITSEAVRAWLDQAMQAQEQRLLFTVLQHVRFVSTPQIVEKVVNAHDAVVNRLVPRKLRESKLERRRDLWITYVDGPGKSGSQYARTYAKENGILLDCVQEPGRLGKRLAGRQDGTEELPGAIVIVDDLIATGQSLSGRLEGFAGENADLLTRYKIPLIVVALYATQEGQEVLERLVKRLAPIQVILCITEVLGSDAFAFPAGGVGFWCNESERDRARALCTRLGTGLYKHALGFGGQGLLLVFPDTCPNNSLPILFAGRAGANAWNPLFPRPSS